MEDIRRAYSEILAARETNRMDSSSFDYDCNGERAGRVSYFSDKQGLRLIRHTYSEYSHFSATDEYFLKGDSLFFVFQAHVSWHFVGEGETRDDVTQNRFYIIDGKALKCLQKKFTAETPSSTSMQPSMAANRETDCASLGKALDKFKLLATYWGREKYPGCLGEQAVR